MRCATLVLLLCSHLAVAAEPAADLVLRGGAILTGDAARPRAHAVAVRGGVIVAVGDDADVTKLVGAKTRVVELAGRTVVAALTDAHAHLVGLGLGASEIDLRGCGSADDCAHRVERDFDSGRGRRGQWVLGRGWDQNRFPDATFPTHRALDKIVNPVFVERVDGHAGWANAAAMRLAHVDRATEDPPGGRIVRDAAGAPTGVFVDNAKALIEHVIPPPTAAEVEAAILRAQELALAEGLTEVHEMGIGHDTVDAYRRLVADGRLKLRVYALAAADDAVTLLMHPPEAPRRLALFTLRGIKIYADGALGSRGAALLAPYSDDPQNRGLTLTAGDKIERAARAAVKSGWQIAVHAIGDGANRAVLDAYQKAGAGPAQRFRIEHAQVVALDDIPRFAKLGIIASMQPTHATSDSPWAEARLGKERLRGAYAWRRMLDAGVTLAFGSDFPVEAVSVVAGLRAAVERGGWTVGERLTLEEALRAFTTGAAFAAFEEAWRGSATPGMAADLTVFDGPPATLLRARVDATIVGGRVVYERR